MINAEIRSAIDETLEAVLHAWGYQSADIVERSDHYGDRAIFIVARFDRPDQLPPSRVTTDAMVALLDKLQSLGDERIPYLDYVYPADPIEDEAA